MLGTADNATTKGTTAHIHAVRNARRAGSALASLPPRCAWVVPSQMSPKPSLRVRVKADCGMTGKHPERFQVRLDEMAERAFFEHQILGSAIYLLPNST